jgi:hypothetical protein
MTRTLAQQVLSGHVKTYASWQSILRADPCCWCGGPGGTLEHVWPKGQRSMARRYGLVGPQSPTLHTVGACEECNSARGGRSVLTFMLVRTQFYGPPLNLPRRFGTQRPGRRPSGLSVLRRA